MDLKNKAFFCSWGGGMDSCLALYHAIKAGGRPKCLFTIFTENGKKVPAHGLPLEVLQYQARVLAIPLVVRSASQQDYTPVFTETLREFKSRHIEIGVFGDIDVEANRQRAEALCKPVGISPYYPLWKQSREKMLLEFLEAGFKAIIVAVQTDKLGRSFLGRELDLAVLQEIRVLGLDTAGGNGEYHIVVTDGPIFARPVIVCLTEQFSKDGYCHQGIQVEQEAR